MALKLISGSGDRLSARCVTITSAFVVLVAAGCGTTSAPAAFETLPPETTATQTTGPATASAAPATTAPAPKTAVPAPKKPTTTVLAPPPTPHPGPFAPIQGANPAVWISTFCGGFNEHNAAYSALAQSPQSQVTAQDLRNELLQVLDAVQRGSASTANKLTQLGPPGVTGGKQVQEIAMEFFTTTARTYGVHRAKLTALDTNDPDLAEKASQLMPGPADFSVTNTQLDKVTNNQELLPAFLAASECQRLTTPPTPR